jgi:hypothetical protein
VGSVVPVQIERRPSSGWQISGDQLDRVDADDLRQMLERLQGEIAFAALDASQVGPVESNPEGKGFLTDAPGLPIGTQVCSHGSLQVANHVATDDCDCYLTGLQTYEYHSGTLRSYAINEGVVVTVGDRRHNRPARIDPGLQIIERYDQVRRKAAAATDPDCSGEQIAKVSATYVSGGFVGNLERGRQGNAALAESAVVQLRLLDSNELVVDREDKRLGRYQIAAEFLTLETSTQFRRRLKPGAAMISLGAGFLIAAIAFAGLAASFGRFREDTYILIIDDRTDFGVFEWNYSDFGMRLMTRLGGQHS